MRLVEYRLSPRVCHQSLILRLYNQRNAKTNSSPQNYPIRSVISEFAVSTNDPNAADLSTERVILTVNQPFGNHKGGELAFGPDGYLYLGLGDGGSGGDPFGSGQSCSTLLAKILRLDVNSSSSRNRRFQYGIPADNPFVNEPGERGAGRRFGLTDCAIRGAIVGIAPTVPFGAVMWGQDLWEEVDLIVKGGNYGWSVSEGAHHFKPGPHAADYIDPVVEFAHKPNLRSQAVPFPDHGIGLCVIGGYVYRGRASPALQGIYIYGDYVLGTIWGLRYDYDAKKVTAHGALLQQPRNIDTFAEDADGEVYALMQDGTIDRLVAK